jgi:hypothetical protein
MSTNRNKPPPRALPEMSNSRHFLMSIIGTFYAKSFYYWKQMAIYRNFLKMPLRRIIIS